VEPLIKALTDIHSWVRESAAEALGAIGNPRAIEPLKLLIDNEDENKNVQESAAQAIKGFRGKDVK
jgi:HEAT repeat protein